MEISLTKYGEGGFRLQAKEDKDKFIVSNVDGNKALAAYDLSKEKYGDWSVFTATDFIDFIYKDKEELLDDLIILAGVSIEDNTYKVRVVTTAIDTVIEIVNDEGTPVNAFVVEKKPVELNTEMDLVSIVDPFMYDIPIDSGSLNDQIVKMNKLTLSYVLKPKAIEALEESINIDLKLLNKSKGVLYRFGKFNKVQFLKYLIS